jgi:type IX secretion system PorP/SprF family membrane protein
MNRKALALFIIFLSAYELAFSQQDANLSQYMFASQYYNPAFAGVEGVTRFTALHRTQWLGYQTSFDSRGGNPNTQAVLFSTPLFRMNSGIGVHFLNDNLGGLNNIEAQVSYSYHLNVRGNKLSLGVQSGIYSQVIDFDKYRWQNPDDRLRRDGRDSQIRPDLSVGALYRAEKYYAGLSVKHLVKSQFDWGVDALRNPLESHMILTGGYDYEVNYNFVVSPSVLIISDFNQFSYDLNVMGTYNDKMWGGLSFRRSEALIMMLGYSMFKDNSLRFGYAFDFIVQGKDAKSGTSHEVFLSYVLPAATAGGKKIVRTPRFRH